MATIFAYDEMKNTTAIIASNVTVVYADLFECELSDALPAGEIGRNVLRRYATAEKQWADAKAHEMSSGSLYFSSFVCH